MTTHEENAYFEEHGRYTYPLNADSVVVDLGGFHGDFAVKIHEKYGCRVFVFEPVAHIFEQLFNRVRGAYPAIRAINFAVGGENKDIEGFDREDSSSIYARGDDADGRGRWSAGMITMDRALEIVQAPEVALLKINIEASEFELLEDMVRKKLLSRFKALQIQWHDMVPDATNRFEVLQNELAKTHELTFGNGWVWQSWKLK